MSGVRLVSSAKHPIAWGWLAAALAVGLCLPGCVRRRMTIRTDPPGALAFVDDQEIGVTPVSTEFTYYGTRKLQLVRDGYETLTVKQTFFAPWYEWPVLEFFSENLWPHETRDEHIVDFQLQPQQILPTDKLMERAEGLRVGARQGYAVSLPNATPTPQPVTPLPAVPPGLTVPSPAPPGTPLPPYAPLPAPSGP